MSKGLLVVVSRFSGSAKGTLMKALTTRYEGYALSVSATSRAPREGEVDGREYFFLSEERFREMIRNDELVEYAQYVGNFYGTPRSFVEEKRSQGLDVLLEIEIQGARNIRRHYPDALLVFVTPPSAEELRKRLVGRGTETMDVIKGRLRRAIQEADGVELYDYILVNDDIDTCTEKLHNLIRAARERAPRHTDMIEEIRNDLRRIGDAASNI